MVPGKYAGRYDWKVVAEVYKSLGGMERLATLEMISDGEMRLMQLRGALEDTTGRRIPASTVQNYLHDLVEQGLAERIGATYQCTVLGEAILGCSLMAYDVIARDRVQRITENVIEKIRAYPSLRDRVINAITEMEANAKA